MNDADSLTSSPLLLSESKILAILNSRRNQVVTRDEIAQALWGALWLEKYSDTVIDTQIYRLRKKLLPHFSLLTIRNRGFMLHPIQTSPLLMEMIDSIITPPPYTYPSRQYIDYMNNPDNVRLTLSDLFYSVNKEGKELSPKTILVIDSYSSDNIDSVIKYFPESEIYFSGFDERALFIHRTRAEKLNAKNIHVLYDDIRNSRFKESSFDLIINDFRLNFNTNHDQNLRSLENMYHILKPGGQALVSVVVDARYESPRFGTNQQKAPLNISSPWQFQADEGLTRNCYTVPYYKKIFSVCGFTLTAEFDLENGKTWAKAFKSFNPAHAPFFRRFLLKK